MITPARLALAALWLAPLAAACSSGGEPVQLDSGVGGGPVAQGSSSSGSSGGDIDQALGQGGANAPYGRYHDLCGSACIPATGDTAPCDLPPPENDGAGGDASGGNGGAGGEGAGGASGEDEGSCRLAYEDGEVVGTCALSGSSTGGQPCLTSSDCAAGFGCVEGGVCRPYCCGDIEACPAQSFCHPTPMAAGDLPPGASETPVIPVCVPAEPCTLLADETCSKPEQTCTIVRKDGTTSCVAPGSGALGDACPCAAGHVCSFADQTCLKLCRTNQQGDCPAGYQCSGGSKPYPMGYGVCVEL